MVIGAISWNAAVRPVFGQVQPSIGGSLTEDRCLTPWSGAKPMPDRDSLVHALAQLDLATFEDVITSAYRQRYDSEGVTSQPPPGPQATRQQFAEWLAKRHLTSDAAIERAVYLPIGSPDDEIRLLEVNRFINRSDSDVVEPLDFTPDTDPPFKVFVADVTMNQWERIQQMPESILPPGWRLDGYEIITRG
jgi:hypothetical protein